MEVEKQPKFSSRDQKLNQVVASVNQLLSDRVAGLLISLRKNPAAHYKPDLQYRSIDILRVRAIAGKKAQQRIPHRVKNALILGKQGHIFCLLNTVCQRAYHKVLTLEGTQYFGLH